MSVLFVCVCVFVCVRERVKSCCKGSVCKRKWREREKEKATTPVH